MGTDSVSDGAGVRRRPPISRMHLFLAMLVLILTGCANYVLLKVTYTAYGDRRSFFVTQAINFLYLGYGGLALYPRMLCTDHITASMYSFPKRHFVVMGILDSIAGLLLSMGMAHTPGSLTLLLNQLLIPFTMLIARARFQTRYQKEEALGAGLIVVGACLSALTQLLMQGEATVDADAEARWYAIVLYALGHLPLAMSAVYKEATFDDAHLDVWYVTQWVSIVQFFASFFLIPALVLPGFGSKDGMSVLEVKEAMVDGYRCFLEQDEYCHDVHAFFLLLACCGVNVCFTTAQLYLTKYGSAVLSALGMSLLLPITTGLFFLPILGSFQEPLTKSSAFTFAGLLLTLLGFGIYQRYATNVGHEDEEAWVAEYKKS
mmetsp:Transcript_38105/g.89271  ORF Transcript_38105/g.89271 Transcript_38105/m.89271 type:complete len:375 (+) Transcript_38105:79-1203(+)